jgi:hypothetical protein
LQNEPPMTTRVMCFVSLGLASIAIAGPGCGAGYRRDYLGRSGAQVALEPTPTEIAAAPAAPASNAPGSGAVAVRAGDDLEIAWTITQPRAERLRYSIECGGTFQEPVEVGETLEQYQARRLAELRAQRDRDRAVVSSVASALVPDVAAGAAVQTPTAQGHVTAGVDRHAVGDAVAANVIDDVQLAPGDVGGGALTGVERLVASSDGTCTMIVYTDTPGVTGVIAVTKVVDVGAERRARDDARRTAALDARGALTASLYAAGARDRVAAPEPVAAVEVPRPRVDVEADVRVDLALQGSLALRGRYVRYLVGKCHADPHHRQREAERAVQRTQLALDLRGRLYLQLVGFGADPQHRAKLHLAAAERDRVAAERDRLAAELQLQLQHRADATRVAMVDFLIALGARLRPPMPPARPEDPGDAPFSDAVWIAGGWVWVDAEWQWRAGGWRDGTTFGGDVTVDNAGWTTRDHRTDAAAGGGGDTWTTRDHRGDSGITVHIPSSSEDHGHPSPGAGSGLTVRDHRGDRDDHVVVRDHRSGDKPTRKDDGKKDRDDNRDKDRDKDKDKDDGGTVTRDHRRR